MNQNSIHTVSIIGLGGLGCPALLALISNWNLDQKLNLNLIDDDCISLSNLNRQVLYSSKDVGNKKIDVALENIKKLHPEVLDQINFNKIYSRINSENIHGLLNNSQFILDCTDDVETKILLNSYALKKNKILVYAGVQSYSGIILLIKKGSPCLNCVFGSFNSEEACELGGSCRSGGVLGSIAGLCGYLQALEVINYINSPKEFIPQIISINKNADIRKINPSFDASCPNKCSKDQKTLDLTSFKCPETFLYAKLGLEKIKKDINIKFCNIIFRNEEDLHNVESSLKIEGYQNISQNIDKSWELFEIAVNL